MRYFETRTPERVGFDFYCDLANNIVEARKKKKWTQEELSKKSGINWSRISAIETVKTKIKLTDLEKLSKCLDVTINYLIDAEIDSQIGECLYLIWPESLPGFKLYQKSTSKRMAFLQYEKHLNECGVAPCSCRERTFVKLVGVSVTNEEIRDKFPKLTDESDEL